MSALSASQSKKRAIVDLLICGVGQPPELARTHLPSLHCLNHGRDKWLRARLVAGVDLDLADGLVDQGLGGCDLGCDSGLATGKRCPAPQGKHR